MVVVVVVKYSTRCKRFNLFSLYSHLITVITGGSSAIFVLANSIVIIIDLVIISSAEEVTQPDVVILTISDIVDIDHPPNHEHFVDLLAFTASHDVIA